MKPLFLGADCWLADKTTTVLLLQHSALPRIHGSVIPWSADCVQSVEADAGTHTTVEWQSDESQPEVSFDPDWCMSVKTVGFLKMVYTVLRAKLREYQFRQIPHQVSLTQYTCWSLFPANNYSSIVCVTGGQIEHSSLCVLLQFLQTRVDNALYCLLCTFTCVFLYMWVVNV